MRGYSNKPEPNRASRVVDVGLASRATRVRLTSTIKGASILSAVYWRSYTLKAMLMRRIKPNMVCLACLMSSA